MLRQVLLEIINARGTASLNDLSRKMGIKRSVLGGMLNHLVHKGCRRDEIQ
jgi:DNA-binding IclR family transcriptional regulator